MFPTLPRAKVIVEIVVVGNELLNGTTLDTNSHWISRRLQRVGAIVSRKTTIRDNVRTISDTLREAYRRKPNWIITIGGLGPTFDDLTFSGVAASVHAKLERDKLATRYLKESYRRRNIHRARLSKSTLKMTEIPNGAVPLSNPVGSAPAILLDHEGIRIVSFPGVPSEMKAIFEEHVKSRIIEEIGDSGKRKQLWIETIGVRESQIATATAKIMDKYGNDLYLKSHPMGFDKEHRSIIRFQLILENTSEKGNSSFEKAERELRKATSKYGIIRKERIVF